MPFFWGIFIYILVQMMIWIANLIGYKADVADIQTTANFVAIGVLGLLVGLVNHFFPKFWKTFKTWWQGGGLDEETK